MIKEIVRDIFFLGQPSQPATEADIQVGKDLQDTLQANRERCVGMAANMIGVKKNIIIVNMGFIDVVMFNPVIISKSGMYETEEGCLSLDGVRKTIRYQEIEVEYYLKEEKLIVSVKNKKKQERNVSCPSTKIGLNNCKAIMEKHGGRLEIEETEESFRITLYFPVNFLPKLA